MTNVDGFVPKYPDPGMSDAEGIKAVEDIATLGFATNLCMISGDARLSEKIRESAGMKAVELYVVDGRYEILIEMSENMKLPKSVREAANSNVEPAVMKVLSMLKPETIEKMIKKGGWSLKMMNELREQLGFKLTGNRPGNPLANSGVLSIGTVRVARAPAEPVRTLPEGKVRA